MGQNKDATRCGQGQEKHSLGNIHMVSDVNRKEEKDPQRNIKIQNKKLGYSH